jgi:hypothetical protein
MRAGVFIRYHSGDGFGHVGWAFDAGGGLVDAGSVENHSGHIFTPATEMGFWNDCFTDPVEQMRKHGYDDLKWIDVPDANPALAHRTVLWIKHEAYKALHRNCEDDVYDVLRAYGAQHIPWPTLLWFPNSWFKHFRATLEHVAEFEWHADEAGTDASIARGDATPWRPPWRRPWHPHFHLLNLRRSAQLLRVARH